MFYFRSAADHRCFIPFITMVDDGTQQHHEHLSVRPNQAILVLIFVDNRSHYLTGGYSSKYTVESRREKCLSNLVF
jgi:hypothetical protein